MQIIAWLTRLELDLNKLDGGIPSGIAMINPEIHEPHKRLHYLVTFEYSV